MNGGAAPDGTNKGNLLDTNLFDDQYEVQFQENGGDWQIQLFKAEAGGNRASQGPAFNTGNPNNPEVYSFWLDTRAGHNYAAVKNAAGTPLINTTAANVPDLPSSFAEDTIFDQWFIGYGSGEIGGVQVHSDADTELNDNKGDTSENSGDSTCIFDDVGTSVCGPGGCGTAPGSSIPPSDGGGDEGDDQTTQNACGLGDVFGGGCEGGGVMLSLLYILCFAVGGYGLFPKSPTIGLVLGAVLGLVYSIFAGIMPGIITFALVAVGLLVGGMRFLGGSSSDGVGG